MKSSTNRPMKSVLAKTALCGLVAVSFVSQQEMAQGAIMMRGGGGGRGRAPAHVHHNPAPRPAPHPNAVARREAPRPPQKPAAVAARVEARTGERIAPHMAPKVAVGWRPVSIRNLEFVAHLRRELYSHRWSFVYAPSLKTAPKSVRFLQNGTVETGLKGERWYWQALDGRRVTLRTLADASQPGIVLDFNEGYTGFTYTLPDQTVAVQGAELNAIAEGPAPSNSTASSTDSAPGTLEQALLSYQWNWNDVSGQSDQAFISRRTNPFTWRARPPFGT
jgi:hypothetical protein